MPQRAIYLLAVLLATVVALATALVVVARQSGPERPQPLLTADLLDRTVPKLTVQQRQQVAGIAVNDPRIRKLIQEQPVEVADVLVWTKSNGELIGGVVTLALAGPRRIAGEWLALNYDGTEATSPPYETVPYGATYSNVTSLTVMVDLNRGQVVGVSPDQDAQAEGTPEVPRDFIPPRGGTE